MNYVAMFKWTKLLGRLVFRFLNQDCNYLYLQVYMCQDFLDIQYFVYQYSHGKPFLLTLIRCNRQGPLYKVYKHRQKDKQTKRQTFRQRYTQTKRQRNRHTV